MTVWGRLIEWYFRLPPTAAGEGTRWSWSWQPPWPQGWPLSVVAAVTVALLVGFWWAGRRDAAALSRGARVLLLGLRLLAIAIALGLWAQPTLRVARTGLPCVAVLVDRSASMGLTDPPAGTTAGATQPSNGPASDRADVATAAADTGVRGLRRWDAALTVLTEGQGRWLSQILDRHPLRVYEFSGDAAAWSVGEISDRSQLGAALDVLQAWQPDGSATRPAEAVKQILAELRGAPPAALVIFTDGIASEGDDDKLSTVADLIRRRGVPLFVIPVGSETATRDVQLVDVVMDDVAFRGDPMAIVGKVKGAGVTGKPLSVQIINEATNEVLGRTEVVLRSDQVPVRFETTITLNEPGELDLRIEIPPLPGETDASNNLEKRHVSVREEKVQVLLVEGSPRYEFRYLKQWFERDKSVALKTLLLEADPDFAREDRTALPYFPVTRDELWKFDVIVLGDVAPLALGGTAAEWLTGFVKERGGGLLLIAGPRHNPQQFSGSPLEGLLPFPMEAVGRNDSASEPFSPQLTLDGQKGVPFFRFAASETASQSIWTSLPGLYGLMELKRLKPGARVLAEHPFRRGESERLPVFVLQQVGAGKVLYHATDETWRWRFRIGDRHYGRYWGQAVRFLSRSKLLGKERLAELIVDRQVYRAGEPVAVRVRFADEQKAPTGAEPVEVLLERSGGERRTISLTRLPFAPTVFEGQVTNLSDGVYRGWVSQPTLGDNPPTVDFRIERLQRELLQRNTDRADLQLAADRAGGELVSLSEAREIPPRIPPGTAIPLEQGTTLALWRRAEPLLLLVGVLAIEWTLRRRWRLV